MQEAVHIFIKPKIEAIFRTLPRRDIFYQFNAAEHNEVLWYRQIKRAPFAGNGGEESGRIESNGKKN